MVVLNFGWHDKSITTNLQDGHMMIDTISGARGGGGRSFASRSASRSYRSPPPKPAPKQVIHKETKYVPEPSPGFPMGTLMAGGLAGYLIANSGEVHAEDKQELTRYCTSADVRPEDKDTCATLVQNAAHDTETDGTSLLGVFCLVALIAALIYIVLR